MALPLRAAMPHEVFAVPPVVAAAFRSGGLAAFDPFDPWQGENAKPAKLLDPAITGADAAHLPPGACYDVLPAWTARGFKPHESTRVLYHPATQLLFARIAPEDDAQVRAFCEWPPAMWMSETYWGNDWVKQVQLRVTTYAVPAAGPGGWQFRPATVTEFLALPEAARAILQRQSFVIRGGQRSKVEGYTTMTQTRGPTLSGMVVEAEVTVAEDGSTVEINLAPEMQVRLADGSRVILRSQFQQLIQWGSSWLMEAGTLPGTPPQRLFQVWEVLRAHAGVHDDPTLSAHWIGRSDLTATGRVVWITNDAWEFPTMPADPFETRPKSKLPEPLRSANGGGEALLPPPALPVPDLFGDVAMQDVGSLLEAATAAPAGSLKAWRRPGIHKHYIHGTPEGMAAVARWLETRSIPPYPSTALAEATFTAIPSRRILWRGAVPVRGGQRSRIALDALRSAEAEELPPPLAEIELEAYKEEHASTDPFEEQPTYTWEIEAAASLRAPFVDAPLEMPAQKESGTAHGVVLSRAIGRSAGEAVVLTIYLHEVKVRSPWWAPAPAHDWWWRRQVEKSAK